MRISHARRSFAAACSAFATSVGASTTVKKNGGACGSVRRTFYAAGFVTMPCWARTQFRRLNERATPDAGGVSIPRAPRCKGVGVVAGCGLLLNSDIRV